MLITLEGIDGSGKTTVAEALQDAHPEAVFTREPTDSWYGEAVQRSIGDDEAASTESLARDLAAGAVLEAKHSGRNGPHAAR